MESQALSSKSLTAYAGICSESAYGEPACTAWEGTLPDAPCGVCVLCRDYRSSLTVRIGITIAMMPILTSDMSQRLSYPYTTGNPVDFSSEPALFDA